MLKRVLLVGIVGLMSIAWAGPSQAQDDLCFNKMGYYNPETGQCELKAGIMIDIDYPMAVIGGGAIEAEVDAFIASYRAEFVGYFVDSLTFFGSAPWSLSMDYEFYDHSPQVRSLLLTIYEYSGGAHGNLGYKSFTYDVATGELYDLFDLFQDEFNPMPLLSSLTQAQLLATISDMTDADWIASGTGEDPLNYQQWVLTETELVFLFPPYQVAAYAAGPQMVRIPLTDLSAILKPSFLP